MSQYAYGAYAKGNIRPPAQPKNAKRSMLYLVEKLEKCVAERRDHRVQGRRKSPWTQTFAGQARNIKLEWAQEKASHPNKKYTIQDYRQFVSDYWSRVYPVNQRPGGRTPRGRRVAEYRYQAY
jgi:hypothetical protein